MESEDDMLIESQKVIDIIEEHKGYGINGIIEDIVEDIDRLCSDWEKMGLSINKEQEPNTGHWIVYKAVHTGEILSCKCSECGEELIRYPKFKYCPNCGSYNGGDTE